MNRTEKQAEQLKQLGQRGVGSDIKAHTYQGCICVNLTQINKGRRRRDKLEETSLH